MAIQISDHFTLGRLARFTAPTCAMMLFASIYGVIDGLFVSNFVGKESFAALNLVYPLFMMLGALGYMFGTGGTALVAKTLGEGDDKRARGLFSLIVYATLIVGIACGVVVFVAVGSVAGALGAEGSLLEECVVYGSILAFSLPFFMLQETFQSLLTARRPVHHRVPVGPGGRCPGDSDKRGPWRCDPVPLFRAAKLEHAAPGSPAYRRAGFGACLRERLIGACLESFHVARVDGLQLPADGLYRS